MDNGGQHASSSDQNNGALSIAFAASSMINASDVLPPEAYQANLKRIQEVKEIVRRLEANNDMAHKNYLLNELEKRAREGREAEEMLMRLKNTTGLRNTLQFTNHPPIEQPNVILPSTATLVEVPEARISPSYSPPIPTGSYHGPPPMVQQRAPQQPPSTIYPQQADSSIAHGQQGAVPPPINRQPSQHAAAPQTQARYSRQGQESFRITGYAQQNPPGPHSQQYNNHPTWSAGYSHPVIPQHLPYMGYNQAPPIRSSQTSAASQGPSYGQQQLAELYNAQQARTGPSSAQGVPIAGPSRPTVNLQPMPASQMHVTPAPPANVHSRPESRLPPGVSSQQPPTQASSQQAAFGAQLRQAPEKISFALQPNSSQHQPGPQTQAGASQSTPAQPTPPTAPVPQRPPRHPSPPTRQSSTGGPPPPTAPTVTQAPQVRILQPIRSQSQTSPPQSQPQPANLQEQQWVSQSQSATAQPLAKPTNLQDQRDTSQLQSTAQTTARPVINKNSFIFEFQRAIKLGPKTTRDFWAQAAAAGISKDWFQAGIDTIPKPIWVSTVEQVRQLEFPNNVQPQPAALQPGVPATSAPVASTSSASILPSSAPIPSTAPVSSAPTQSTVHPPQTISIPGREINIPPGITHSVPGQPTTPYHMAAQLKFYSDEAARAALAAQGVRIPMMMPATAPPAPVTPDRSTEQSKVKPRTPQQVDKSRLARDILRSLGRRASMPGKGKEKAAESTTVEAEKEEEGGEESMEVVGPSSVQSLPEATPSVVPIAFSKPLTPPLPTTNTAPLAVSPSMAASVPVSSPEPPPSSEVSASASPPKHPKTDSVPPKHAQQCSAVPEGPVTIDLTLDDSDDSASGREEKATFPIKETSKVPSPPASPAHTTTHMPQLESLSLAETRVEAETGAQDVDVRMESPPPSFSGAVDDVERQLELSYPEPEAVVLTPTSLKAPSQEASEGASSSKLPLFLPSPSISPVVSDHSPATGPPETDDEVIIVEDNVKPSLKRRSTEVESMAGDASISPPRVRKRRKQQVYVLVPPPPSPVQKIIERMKMKERAIADDVVSGSEEGEDDEELRYNHLEQVVIEESKSRLMERRCRWLNCEAILNCGHNLLAHLKVHADEDSSQAPFRCHWTGCRRKFRTSDERDVHLGRHTIFPLPCPFAGCDEEFGMPIEVMHHEVQHQNQGHRRPLLHKLTSKPFVPSIPARLGRPPLRLPSSCVLPRRVLRARISADRHAVMGPWVLWNIFSPVDLNMRKQNATMRGGPTRQGGDNDAKGPDSRRDEYDFLLPLSPYPSKIPPLDDLNSGLVTALASRGLTLWGPETPLNSLDEPARPAESLARNDEPVPSAADTAMSDSTTDALMMVEGKATVTDLVAPSAPKDIATEEPQSAQSMGTAGEEEAVERMLVL